MRSSLRIKTPLCINELTHKTCTLHMTKAIRTVLAYTITYNDDERAARNWIVLFLDTHMHIQHHIRHALVCDIIKWRSRYGARPVHCKYKSVCIQNIEQGDTFARLERHCDLIAQSRVHLCLLRAPLPHRTKLLSHRPGPAQPVPGSHNTTQTDLDATIA